MFSILRRSVRPVFRLDPAAWVCRRCYSTPDAVAGESEAVKPARTRFAPSPTGSMHLGSLRTALYNYLLARNTGGQFILRIEDTDKKRTVEGAEENIYDTLRWAGLQWDEGPEVGGKHGPYKQSERTLLYRAHAKRLLQGGHAYRCFCPPHRLAALATKRQDSGLPVEYDRRCYNFTETESDSRAASGEPHVVRLLAPDQWPSFKDSIYGLQTYSENSRAHSEGFFEDPVLLKSDGMPTYHLASVVDDHHMHITHVLRATEWMPSTPKHMHLYNCFEWDSPQWVHVGLLQGKDHAKLSKRSGGSGVSYYREKGYTPDALNNFVALLGWSHGGDGRSDVMTLEEMVRLFNVEGLTAGNTIVNLEKLPFLQKGHWGMHFEANKGAEDEEVSKISKEVRALYGDSLETGEPITTDYIREILKVNMQNYRTAPEFAVNTSYFFRSPTFDACSSVKTIVKFRQYTGMSTMELYHGFIEAAEKIPDTPETWDIPTLKTLLTYEQELDREVWAQRMRLLRIALCAGNSGPSIAETMYLLGKSRTIARLHNSDAAFEEYKGELNDAEEEFAKAHDKMLKAYKLQQAGDKQGEKLKPGKGSSKGGKTAMLVPMAPPHQAKGYKYMPKPRKAMVDKEYQERMQEAGMKVYKPKYVMKNWAKAENSPRKRQSADDSRGDDWN